MSIDNDPSDSSDGAAGLLLLGLLLLFALPSLLIDPPPAGRIGKAAEVPPGE